jgi:hypothetical protein
MVEGCSSDETAVTDEDAGIDTGSSSGSTSDGSSGGGDGNTSSSGNPASNPGKVTCGAAECDAGINAGNGDPQCCYRAADAATPSACVANGAACTQGGHRLRCDEPADCDPGDRCCIDTSGGGGGGGATASCQGNCNAQDELDLCKDNSQCGDGGTCRQVTCNNGRVYRTCQAGANTNCQ